MAQRRDPSTSGALRPFLDASTLVDRSSLLSPAHIRLGGVFVKRRVLVSPRHLDYAEAFSARMSALFVDCHFRACSRSSLGSPHRSLSQCRSIRYNTLLNQCIVNKQCNKYLTRTYFLLLTGGGKWNLEGAFDESLFISGPFAILGGFSSSTMTAVFLVAAPRVLFDPGYLLCHVSH